MLKGYRSFVVAGVGVLVSVAPLLGIEITDGQQQELITSILFVIAFGLRFVTDTAPGQS